MIISSEELAGQQLDTLGPDVRLVIFNPDFRQQHALLSRILAEPGTAYVRLNGAGLTRGEVEAQIQAALDSTGERARLEDLSALVIDECDRIPQDEAADFLSWLILEKRPGRLYLFTRRVPDIVLEDAELRRQTRFVPDEENLMLVGYAARDGEASALLEVRALGPGRVQLNGKPVVNWDGVLPRTLFLYLIDRGMTTRQEIFETFWPNLTTREATNVFHVTKRKINEVLGMDLTVYWSGFYHVTPKIQLNYDASLFTGLVQDSAVVSNDEAIDLLRHAVALYRTDFLVGINMSWAARRRDELRQTYGEALVALARALERNGELKQALGLYLRAATNSRHREDLATSIMRLYRDLGMTQDAVQIYERLEQELQTKLGVPPAPHVRALVDSIRADMN